MSSSYSVISRSGISFSTLPSSSSSSSLQPNRICFPTRNRRGVIRAAINNGNVSSVSIPSFYELLGISEKCNSVEIKQAYKQLARKYHPDVSPADRVEEYTERFIRVHEAYETLSDPGMRAMYDCDMMRGIHLSFSSRNRCQSDEGMMNNNREWRNRWQMQLWEMGMRRNVRRKEEEEERSENLTWGARMRRQREE
ncbi:chaperone protein dnaJ 20, chloroplastic-like [Impatiens glandulifera]|uniref:chaperone protein dnaJ 20, chloroplastic-like n=1 Tax=Impatiens glandulifera TaxID=253017 RepID=UPI001FB0958F|nr:chaperone protein dnaJ 20, chloroplastic-like [Impatiens glandulifera]